MLGCCHRHRDDAVHRQRLRCRHAACVDAGQIRPCRGDDKLVRAGVAKCERRACQIGDQTRADDISMARSTGHILTRRTQREIVAGNVGKNIGLNCRSTGRPGRRCGGQRDRLGRRLSPRRIDRRERVVLGCCHRDVLASSNLQRSGVIYNNARDIYSFGQDDLVR